MDYKIRLKLSTLDGLLGSLLKINICYISGQVCGQDYRQNLYLNSAKIPDNILDKIPENFSENFFRQHYCQNTRQNPGQNSTQKL